MNRFFRGRLLPLTLLLAGALFVSCDDDDNPASEHGEHLDAIGVALVMAGDTLVKAEGTTVSGELEVHEGETLGPLLVHFLSDEGEWFRPDADAGSEYSLDVDANGLVVHVDVNAADWSFTVEGEEEAETVLVIHILHEDHADYTSPELPLHVHHTEGAHGEPVGMRLLDADSTIVLETFADQSVSGELEVPLGTTVMLEAWFVDDEGVVFQPEDDHSLGVTEETGGILGITVTGWNLDLEGLSAGHEHLVFDVLHGGHSHFTSPEVHVDVD